MGWGSTSTTSGTDYGTAGSNIFYVRVEHRAPPPPPVRAPAFHPCAVLGVPCKAPPEQVKSAYRRLAKECHPDAGPPEEREARTRKMALINQAFGMLNKGA